MSFCNFGQVTIAVIIVYKLLIAKNSGALNKKMGRFRVVDIHVANRTLYKLFKMVLVKFVPFVVFEISRSLVFMGKLSNANNC